ncbi:macro domain-containing protein LMOf2365_2748-like [Anneissia japonica]|uniref:macro domain-containing protein LMOf2365_2748-like n=1 Tax=Anneissia japonica TaxID=1529436 RepID=UPI001425B929|nr:macro domain-containing protein LMOf2365_2748-like [Anneissia japonica]
MVYAILQCIYTGLKYLTDAHRMMNAAIAAWNWIHRNKMNIPERELAHSYRQPYGTRYIIEREIEVIIRRGDIADEDVDVIVNGVDGKLRGGAVARDISMEAGEGISEERKQKMSDREGRELEVTEVLHTGGHNLKAKYVLHAVGPPSKLDNQFSYLLKQTFYNCLEYADVNLEVTSIAIPLIGSGVVGGRMEDCAESLVHAVKNFSQNYSFKTVNEIRLVNIDAEATSSIETKASDFLYLHS